MEDTFFQMRIITIVQRQARVQVPLIAAFLSEVRVIIGRVCKGDGADLQRAKKEKGAVVTNTRNAA